MNFHARRGPCQQERAAHRGRVDGPLTNRRPDVVSVVAVVVAVLTLRILTTTTTTMPCTTTTTTTMVVPPHIVRFVFLVLVPFTYLLRVDPGSFAVYAIEVLPQRHGHPPSRPRTQRGRGTARGRGGADTKETDPGHPREWDEIKI